MVERIRVLIAGMERMLSGAIRQIIANQPDMEVVDETNDGIQLLMSAGWGDVDVVILGLPDSEPPGICSHLLAEYPHIKILGVTADGRWGYLYELQPHMVPLGEVSQDDLLAVIRAAVRNGGGLKTG